MHFILSVALGVELLDYLKLIKNPTISKLDLCKNKQEGPYVAGHCWIYFLRFNQSLSASGQCCYLYFQWYAATYFSFVIHQSFKDSNAFRSSKNLIHELELSHQQQTNMGAADFAN